MVTCSNINKEHYNELQKQVKEEGKVVMISSTQSSKTHNTKEHTVQECKYYSKTIKKNRDIIYKVKTIVASKERRKGM